MCLRQRVLLVCGACCTAAAQLRPDSKRAAWGGGQAANGKDARHGAHNGGAVRVWDSGAQRLTMGRGQCRSGVCHGSGAWGNPSMRCGCLGTLVRECKVSGGSMRLDVCAGNADAERMGSMLEPQAALTTVSGMPRVSTDATMSKHKRTSSM
jgi:hypothetical protein